MGQICLDFNLDFWNYILLSGRTLSDLSTGDFWKGSDAAENTSQFLFSNLLEHSRKENLKLLQGKSDFESTWFRNLKGKVLRTVECQ